jgi:hypothetical protein
LTVCSETVAGLAEPLAGTAPVARTWVVLEQPGPWGSRALTESHLDPVLGEALDVAAKAHGARVALARRAGRHPDRSYPDSRRLWVASTEPGTSWLLGGWIDDISVLGGLSWNELERGNADGVRDSVPGLNREVTPLLLVCTNGRRDVCCAIRGRALVTALRDRLLGRVWETTHLSGHRFAPTAVLLPHGLAYGRLPANTAAALFDDANRGRFTSAHYRGRSTFTEPGQAAEAAVREAIGASGLNDLDVAAVEPVGPGWRVAVTHRDGRRWQVDVTRRAVSPPRPESCGGAVKEPASYIAGPPERQR